MGKQLSFDKYEGSRKALKDNIERIEHGGELNKGKRKLYRPIDSKRALHVTMRSSKARGAYSLMRPLHRKEVERRLYQYAERFGVRVFKYANGGNHLHILLKPGSRRGFQNFLRTFAGVIPRLVTQARKGKAKGKFWDALAYSKLVTFGRQFKNTSNYIFRNTLEAFGVIPQRKDARGHLKIDFLSLFDDYG